MEFISINDVLKIMDMTTPDGYAVPFDIEVREFSRQNKTGGRLKVYNNARKLVKKPKNPNVKVSVVNKLLQEEQVIKNPFHFENRTRNIELADGSIKKIHYLFIIKFNGKKVIY